MKIAAIKKMVAAFSVEELNAAEEALLEENTPKIEVIGDDEGEQLTHIMAAIWVKDYMVQHPGAEIKTAIREYTIKVRNSIS